MPRIESQLLRSVAVLRILIVEDEAKVAKAVSEGLAAERYEVRIAATGEEGFFLLSQESFDLVLLDLMLPRRDGLEILTALRKRGVETPVLGAAGVRAKSIVPRSFWNRSSGSVLSNGIGALSAGVSSRSPNVWSRNCPQSQPHCVTPFSEKMFWPTSLKTRFET